MVGSQSINLWKEEAKQPMESKYAGLYQVDCLPCSTAWFNVKACQHAHIGTIYAK